MNCPVCLSSRNTELWSVGGYAVSECEDCTHRYVSVGLAPGELDVAYEHEYYDSSVGSTRTGYEDYLANAELRMRGFARRLGELEQHTAPRGRLLDFGCAVGLFVKVAVDAGWDAVGYERSAWAADYGRRHLGVTIQSGQGSQSEFDPQSFDMVTMWDVLEHLEDPNGVIRSVASWLRPGGVLALNTVDSGSIGARMAGEHWRHVAPPHHLQYFTRKSLTGLLRDAGFRLLERQSRGVLWRADRRRAHLGGWRSVSESMVTHWRARSVADALNLLDEVDVVAVLESPVQARKECRP